MKILVVGGGGREHALIWKLSQSKKAPKIYCAPGNGGIAQLAECVPIGASDVGAICNFAEARRVDMVVVGPDDPLALGCADACEARGIRVFGPRRAEARLEWSKIYAKELMKRHGVPTADFQSYDDAGAALAALASARYPLFVKADGLALGKGAVMAADRAQAEAAVRSMMLDKSFGDAGSRILLEECLEGPEITVLAFTDGNVIKPMLSSQDHKRAFDGDLGPNTGGMGAIAPSPAYTAAIERECAEKVFAPTLDMLRREGIRYRGVLYFGLMLTGGGVRVIEYNARFGDPEAQPLMTLLKNDLIDVFDAVIDGRLDKLELKWENGFSACVVAASGGYPGPYKTGYEIDIAPNAGALVFHAGTRLENGRHYTSGGRVLGVTARGADLREAVARAYEGLRGVSFADMQYRTDIGGGAR